MPAPKHRSINEKFEECLQMARAIGETNDCSVRAVAFAANISYDEALERMAARGRKPNAGVIFGITERVMLDLGFTCIPRDKFRFIERYPRPHNKLASVTTYHPRRFPGVWKDGKTYLLRSRRHILCVRDGEALDWAAARASRVHTILEVVPL